MAEVAGLVLGVVGIAGVIGAFKDTVDLMNLVADSRHLGRDYQILETKLDIEKMLLLQWAHRVRLLRADYDRRLDDPDTRRLIVKILECVSTLLTDTPELQRRYGLSEVSESRVVEPASTAAIASAAPAPSASGPRWQQFLFDYDTLRSRGKLKPASIPAVKRARWVIRDKQKFELLVQELAHFTSRINDVVPVAKDDGLVQSMVENDIHAIADLRQLKILLEATAGTRQTISDSTERVITEMCHNRILSKLWFRKIDDRRESITEAHQKTLQWALHPTRTEVPWDNFSEWLRSSSGIYWISGKAGSGKSTLMKYFYFHDDTKQHLSHWANEEPYYLCNFFFKNLGTEEQKSQEGLSRTLLYQILSSHRSLIPEVLPHMWKEIHDSAHENTVEDISLPSRAETQHAFDVIAEKCQEIGRFCFFVDGLDELSGNYRDGIKFIQRLVTNDRMKLVISSRPIPECVAAFGGCPNLRLQDLNHDDITFYVQDVAGNHEYMKTLIRRYHGEGLKILEDVVNKSSGVFLWVVLACRALLDGFADHDRISELRRRVDELPPELEDMFQLMLNKINKRHREQGARLLRMCYTHQTAPWPQASRDLCTLGLALVADYNTESLSFRPLDRETKADICLEFEGRLRSRCGGLLEVERGTRPCLCRGVSHDEHDHTVDSQVRFMHRTVFEFLNDELTWNLDCLKVPEDRSFDIATAFSIYGLHLAKERAVLKPGYEDDANSFLGEAIRWAVLADAEPHGQPAKFFNHISHAIRNANLSRGRSSEATSDKHLSRIVYRLRFEPCSHVGLLIAIEAGAVNYVSRHPDLPSLARLEGPEKTGGLLWNSRPIMYHAVHKVFLGQNFCTKSTSNGDKGYVNEEEDEQFLSEDDEDVKSQRDVPTASSISGMSSDMVEMLLQAGCSTTPIMMAARPASRKSMGYRRHKVAQRAKITEVEE